jgi:hypothetical protein
VKKDKYILRNTVYEKFGGRCAYCGEAITLKSMQIDHIIPKSYFLTTITAMEANVPNFKCPKFLIHLKHTDVNHIDNLFPACKTCNSWKCVYSVESFRSELQRQVQILITRSANYRMAKRYKLVLETPHEIEFYFEKIWKEKKLEGTNVST